MKTSTQVRSVLLLGIFLLHLGTVGIKASGAAGKVDLSFDPGSGVDGIVNAIAAQPDGKVIIGGQFTTVRGLVRTNLARLNADGSGDSTFSPAAPHPVHSLALQPDGKVLIGSEFLSHGLTRVNANGSSDTSFNANAYAAISTNPPFYPVRIADVFVQPDGKVIYAGETLMRLNSDGTLDSSFSAGFWGFINATAQQPDGKLIVGYYDGANGYHLVRLKGNGSLDDSFVAGVGGDFRCIVVQPDGKLLLGGHLFPSNATSTGVVARINADGSVDPSFPMIFGEVVGGVRESVRAIAIRHDGTIIIGGQFFSIHGSVRKHLAGLHADGSLDSGFPGNGANGVDGQFGPGTAPAVNALILNGGGEILVGGDFTSIHGENRNRVARLDPNGNPDGGFEPGRGLDSEISALAVRADGKLLVGDIQGDFTPSNNASRKGIERLGSDGWLDAAFDAGTGPNFDVLAVAKQGGGKTLIGGSFITVNGIPRYAFARLNADGSVDASFSPPLANVVYRDPIPPPFAGEYSVAVTEICIQSDGRILIAGYSLTSIYGEFSASMRSFVLRFLADGSVDPSFVGALGDPVDGSSAWIFAWRDYPPSALAIQPNGGIVVGGVFNTISDTNRNGIARLNADGTLDPTFIPSTASGVSVEALATQPDGKVLAGGGYFGLVNGVERRGITRFNADGSPDPTFNPGTGTGLSPGVAVISLQPDGKALIGGTFNTFNGTSRKNVVRINANGSLDAMFNPGLGADGAVRAIALQTDGRVLIAGDFLTVNGILLPRVARLSGDPRSPVSFATWVADFGLTGPNAGVDADPDFDRLPNATEFILGGNPAQPAAAPIASGSMQPVVSVQGGELHFMFSRDDISESPGVTLMVEAGPDLATWPAVYVIGATSATSTPGVTIVENASAPDTITVAIPLGNDPRKFARLKVSITLQ